MSRLVVGIPTRNRAELAITAVESVLRSGQPGVAVVVSDNSTDAAERDRLERFCRGVADEGVAYVRPPQPLPMAAHWEWLWRTIETTAPAPHVAYLTDRLVFAVGALAALLDTVARHPGKVVSYHWDTVDDRTTPVTLIQKPWTGRLYELSSARLIELASRGEFGDHTPRLMNSVVPTGVIEEIGRRFGDVFGSIAPDYRFGYRCLALCETILYLDRPCVVEHGIYRSAGGSFLRGRVNEDASRFATELTDPRFAATPEPDFETDANAIFQEYCAVRAELDGVGFPPLDRRSYLAANAVSIARLEDPEWRRRMLELLRSRGFGRRHALARAGLVALRLASYFARHPAAVGRSLRRQVRKRPPGFGSGLEAVAHASAHPRPAAPQAYHVHALERAGAVVARRR